MSPKSFYCFRCGDPFNMVNGEFYCARGDMYVSKFLSELLIQEAAAKATGEPSSPVEKSSFRCIRCRAFMKQMDPPGTGIQCPVCNMRYTPQMTYNMIERHPHAKFLEPEQKSRYSVVVSRNKQITSEQLAELIQLRTRANGSRAWQPTNEIQAQGQSIVFTGPPQDAELVLSSLNAAGISARLVDDD